MNINNYGQLSSIERHLSIEEFSINKNFNSYESGLSKFQNLLKIDDRIANAFMNFLEYRNNFFNVLPNKDILLFVGFDKFKNEIPYIIKNGDNSNLSFYIYHANENQCELISNRLIDHQGHYWDPLDYNIYAHFYSQMDSTPEHIWNMASLSKSETNPNFIRAEDLDTSTIEYNENDYRTITKKYTSILSQNNPNIKKHFYRLQSSIKFDFHPSHTTLLPSDIDLIRLRFQKNSNSKIEYKEPS